MNKEDNMRNIADNLKISSLDDRNKRIIIIGDIHGCYDELIKLLNQVNYDCDNDIVVSVGDIMAKGPQSLEVLDFFVNNKNTFAVLGNHDYAVLRWLNVIQNNIVPIPFGLKEGSEHQNLANNLNDKQIDFLKNLPHVILIEKYNLIVLHAGLNPNIILQYNNSFDIMFTRNILENGKASELINNGTKWINLWNGPQTVVFGHDATRGIQKTEYAIGLDTGCVYGKYLTCVIYPNNEIISVPAEKSYVKIEPL